jgi:peptide/nickel transport system permease protein
MSQQAVPRPAAAAVKPKFVLRLFGHRLTILALLGLVIIAINVIAAVGAPLIAPFDQADVVGDAWADPDPQHIMGLDNLGRDLFSRLIYGARMSIGLSFVITCLAFAIGVSTGFAAAVMKGWVDMALSRLVDLLLSMPTLIAAFIILSVLGTGLPVIIATVAILDSTKVFRLSRALAMNIAALEYVEVAKVRGEGLWWVIRKEILPNALAPLIAEFGLRFSFAFLFIATLSFLGLGVQPPNADWGSMVRDYRDMINLGEAAPLYPAGAIALLTIGVNFVVDWMLSIHSKAHGGGA